MRDWCVIFKLWPALATGVRSGNTNMDTVVRKLLHEDNTEGMILMLLAGDTLPSLCGNNRHGIPDA